MRLSRELLGAPSAGYALSTVTLRGTDAVGVVVLREDVADRDLLLEEASGKVDLGRGVATVDLELDDVSLLLLDGEGLLLAGAPVLVEASASLVGDVLGPDGLERAQASRRLDVSNNTNANHRRRVNNGDRLDDLLLVELVALASDLTHDVRHTGLVTDEAGEMARLGLVVLGERLEAAEMAAASLAREKSLATVAGCFEFSVRHASVSST